MAIECILGQHILVGNFNLYSLVRTVLSLHHEHLQLQWEEEEKPRACLGALASWRLGFPLLRVDALYGTTRYETCENYTYVYECSHGHVL